MQNRAAFVKLVEREYEVLARTAFLIVGDEGVAREIVQESFTRLAERWKRVGGYDEPGAWLRMVTVRQAVRARDRRRRELLVDVDGQSLARLPVEAVWADRLDVVTAIQSLPPGQREVVVLYYLLDLSTDAIATELRRRPGTVRAQLHQARSRLATVLHQEVGDAPR